MISGKILQWEIGNRIEAKGLNWIQVLVCRLFKIPVPPIKFWVEAAIITNKFMEAHDVIDISGLGRWNVIDKKRGLDIYVISSARPIEEHSPNYSGPITIIREGEERI